MWLLVRDGPHRTPRQAVSPGDFWRGVSGRGPLLALGGYMGHMWELYAMWAWLPVFLAEVYDDAELPLLAIEAGSLAAFAVFAVFALGAASCVVAGVAAERYGRTAVTSVAMAGSGSAALVVGFLPEVALLVTIVALVWGATVVVDSAQFSAAMTELSDPQYRGSALAFQTGTRLPADGGDDPRRADRRGRVRLGRRLRAAGHRSGAGYRGDAEVARTPRGNTPRRRPPLIAQGDAVGRFALVAVAHGDAVGAFALVAVGLLATLGPYCVSWGAGRIRGARVEAW